MNEVFQTSVMTLAPFTDKAGLNFYPDSVEFDSGKAEVEGEYTEYTVDYILAFNAKLRAVNPILKGHAWGDYAYLTIHDPLGNFLMKLGRYYKFDDSVQNQGWIGASYDSSLPMGFIIRFNYGTRVAGAGEINCIFNLELHKIVPVVP